MYENRQKKTRKVRIVKNVQMDSCNMCVANAGNVWKPAARMNVAEGNVKRL